MKLTTDVELAEMFELTLDEFHVLRRRYQWPCVKLGRNRWRFTDTQVEVIIARHTEAGKTPTKTSTTGQTAASIARSA